MTIPEGHVLYIESTPFFLIMMLRPHEDVPGNYITGRAWYWSVYSIEGDQIGYGYVNSAETCRSSARRSAKRWVKDHLPVKAVVKLV